MMQLLYAECAMSDRAMMDEYFQPWRRKMDPYQSWAGMQAMQKKWAEMSKGLIWC